MSKALVDPSPLSVGVTVVSNRYPHRSIFDRSHPWPKPLLVAMLPGASGNEALSTEVLIANPWLPGLAFESKKEAMLAAREYIRNKDAFMSGL